jgi:hypothetical protein
MPAPRTLKITSGKPPLDRTRIGLYREHSASKRDHGPPGTRPRDHREGLCVSVVGTVPPQTTGHNQAHPGVPHQHSQRRSTHHSSASSETPNRPVDAAVAHAFLEAVSPLSVEVSLQVLDQIEHEVAAQRRRWALQLEQARYEVRLAQRQYDAVDPDNRLVAAELERRWNQKLEQLARLEQAYARAEQDAHWELTTEERAAIRALSADLPAIWRAETTTDQERKQLLRFAIEAVFLDGARQAGQIELQIHWRSGTITSMRVRRPAPGEGSLQTPAGAVTLMGELAPTHTYAQIAEQLNAAGWRTAFGRTFTHLHVGYVCRRHGWSTGRGRPTQQAQEDGRPQVLSAARRPPCGG